MSKKKTLLFCCAFVLLATVIMCGLCNMYIISNISYSYVPIENVSDRIIINNIEVINRVDPYRVDGPNIIGNDLDLDIDLKPNETYSFKFDIVNKTDIDYLISKVNINCLNNTKVNDYLSVNMTYDDGTPFDQDTLISRGTKRTVTVSVSYNKNVSSIKTFKLNFDIDYSIDTLR